jgi:hypothetical protein
VTGDGTVRLFGRARWFCMEQYVGYGAVWMFWNESSLSRGYLCEEYSKPQLQTLYSTVCRKITLLVSHKRKLPTTTRRKPEVCK